MRKPAANAALGQAIRLAFDLRMHDDENLDLDPIEREVRRRIFWLLCELVAFTAQLTARRIRPDTGES